VWSGDGKTILFVRETANGRRICSVGESGGPVKDLGPVPEGFIRLESVAPNRKSLVFAVCDAQWKLVLFEVSTRRLRAIGPGFSTAWSPDSRRLYISTWSGSTQNSARILDLATGNGVPLAGDLRAAAWVDENTLVANKFMEEASKRACLVVLRADGSKEREAPVSFTGDKDDGLPCFADNLFAVPGDPGSIVYGRHAGDSTSGDAQLFYLASLNGGRAVFVASGRDLVRTSDKTFLTGAGRCLASLDRKENVWVSPLSVVSLTDRRIRTVVQGLVSVGGFDWRRRP
jgi:hypothetical protein